MSTYAGHTRAQEIDYTLEGQNADRFRQNFKDTDWVRVPRVFWEYTSPEVLVLEYMPGACPCGLEWRV